MIIFGDLHKVIAGNTEQINNKDMKQVKFQ